MFTLRIEIEGPIAIVPTRNADSRPLFEIQQDGTINTYQPDRITLIVPDLKFPRLAKWEQRFNSKVSPDHYVRPAHIPFLAVRPKNILGGTNLKFDAEVTLPSSGQEWKALVLESAELKIDDVAGDPIKANLTRPASLNDKKPGDSIALQASLWWVPRLSDLTDKPYAKKILNTAAPNEFQRNGITARLSLDKGVLAVLGFNSDGKKAWKFSHVERIDHTTLATSGEKWNRVVANRLAWDAVCLGEAAKLTVTTASETKIIEVGPPDFSREDSVTLRFGTTEPESLLFASEALVHKSLPDPDFEVFYELATASPTDGKIYVPVEKTDPDDRTNKVCAPGIFSGFQ